MAPSTVFSYFRSNHHRRTDSAPSSPQRTHQWHHPQPQPQPQQQQQPQQQHQYRPLYQQNYSLDSPSSFRAPSIPSPQTASPVSPCPPVLPPIRRVSSTKNELLNRTVVGEKAGAQPVPRIHLTQRTSSNEARTETPSQQLTPASAARDSSQDHILYSMADADLRPFKNFDAFATTRTSRLALGEQSLSFKPQLAPPTDHAREQNYRPTSAASQLSQHELTAPMRDSRREPSPSSSLSNMQKSGSSTTLTSDISPANSARLNQAPVPKQTKSKINLLNPMSLLMRRRASHSAEAAIDLSKIDHRNLNVPAMSIPEDYDPRIKGKGVHDFNAPRPRQNKSVRDTDAKAREQETLDSSAAYKPETSADSPAQQDGPTHGADGVSHKIQEFQHAPVFVENFDDDTRGDASGIHRESLANPSFLARMSRQLDFSNTPEGTPQTIRKVAESPPQEISPVVPVNQNDHRVSKGAEIGQSYRFSSDQSTARSSISLDTRATSPPLSPNAPVSRSSLSLDPPFIPSGLPKHLSRQVSRASSRFSFQFQSDRSNAQEKALEEKHKQKAAAKVRKPESVVESQYEGSDEEDYGAFDDFDDAGFEEEVPEIGADDSLIEDKEYERASSVRPISVPTNLVGDLQAAQSSAPVLQPPLATGKSHQLQTADQAKPERQETSLSTETDDMYYDDGLIVNDMSEEGQSFDENLLDSPADLENECDEPRWDVLDLSTSNGFSQTKSIDSETTQINVHSTLIAHAQPQAFNLFPSDFNAEALATAVNRAAENGRFRRESSAGTEDSVSPLADIPPKSTIFTLPVDDGAIFEDDQAATPGDYECHLDDDLEDDPMIAAANAEALAADDAGFYGTEFGFYGQPAAATNMWNGGYFGDPSQEGLGRSVSGRNVCREPNLTPITERSEFSTRNSMYSLSAWGSSAGLAGNITGAPGSTSGPGVSWVDQTSPNPGLKELAARIGMDDEDMTLSELLKLRKGTFGGSGHRGSWTGSMGSAPSSPGASFSASSPLVIHPTRTTAPVVFEEEEYGNLQDHEADGDDDLDATLVAEENVPNGSSGGDNVNSYTQLTSSQHVADTSTELTPRKPTSPLLSSSSPSSAQTKPKPTPLQSLLASSSTVTGSPPTSPEVTPRPSRHVRSSSSPLLLSPSTTFASTNSHVCQYPPPAQPVFSPNPSSPRSPSSPSSFSPFVAWNSPAQNPTLPMPPPSMMQKFQTRPPAPAYGISQSPMQMSPGLHGQRFSFQGHAHSNSESSVRLGSGIDATYSAGERGSPGSEVPMMAVAVGAEEKRIKSTAEAAVVANSVAYVRDKNVAGQERWYLERRRVLANGDVRVLARELVEGGRI